MARNEPVEGLGAREHGLDSAILAEQIRLLLHKRVDLPINILNAAIVAAAVWHVYPSWVVLVWLGLFCIVILARALTRRRFRMTSSSAAVMGGWGRVFTLNACATGCLWGLAGSVILFTSDPMFHVFIVFLLGGMMAGGIVSNAAYMPAVYGFMFPTILPAIAALLSRRDLMHVEMGVLLAVFTIVLTVTGKGINRSIIENFRLRIAQDLLLNKVRESEAMMAESQQIAQVGSWEIDLVTNTYVCSLESLRIYGVDPAKIKPTYEEMLARIHPEDRAMVEEDIARTISVGAGEGLDHRLVMDDGTIKHVHELARAVCDKNGRPVRLIGTVQDLTQFRAAEENLKFADLLLKTQMESSPDGILVVDADQRVILSNERFIEIWKIPQATVAAGRDESILAAVTAQVKNPKEFSALVKSLYANRNAISHDEFEMKDGRFIERHTVPLATPDGVYLGRIWFFRDITEAKQAAADALRLARFDPLTGLANRSIFVEALQQAIARAKRNQSGLAVIYLDLDHFKDVNDTMGHAAGDALLQAVADRLRSNTRESDTVSRFGGDEFAIVVADVADPADVAILADKLINVLREPYFNLGDSIFSGASIGIDVYGAEASDAETLLTHADMALYRAKSEGRSGYRFFTEAMDADVRMQVSLGAELHEALDAGQLFLLYQPQVQVDSGRMTGVEALVRWRHPQRGILNPVLFIPVAEKTGIIMKLGHWVILAACRQGKAWIEAGLPQIRISANLSALQFRSPAELEADIGEILAETGLPPHLLELELTETVLMNAARDQSDIIQRLRHIGVSIAIDDFGTGYSSLDYLRRFPADRIKIAQNFVKHLESMPGDGAIVRATVGLARELGIEVIAEGVETREQFEMLKSWNCAEVQGFYFAKPLAAKEVTHLLQKGGILQPAAAQSH